MFGLTFGSPSKLPLKCAGYLGNVGLSPVVVISVGHSACGVVSYHLAPSTSSEVSYHLIPCRRVDLTENRRRRMQSRPVATCRTIRARSTQIMRWRFGTDLHYHRRRWYPVGCSVQCSSWH